MNYYEHHIGDYDTATSHLSAVEDGIYCRLIRKYYSTEKPLPADLKQLQRLVRARSREEKNAVEAVLEEFFYLADDGWHNERCDEDIEKYLSGEPERELKKANESNRIKRHREERSALFSMLTAAGQHAPWNIGITELRALVKRYCGDPATAEQQQPATAPVTPATATQTPIPNTQTPIPNINTLDDSSESPPKAKRKTRIPDDFGLTPEREAAARAYWSTKNRADLDPVDEMAKFIAHHRGKGETYLDWDCVWQTWYSNAIKFNRPSLAVIPGKQNRHANFEQIDYTAGVNPDGSF